jgi:hypothetical protein
MEILVYVHKALIVGIIADVPEWDNHWIALTKDQLGVSEDVLWDYLAHGDSMLLANWIHIIHLLFHPSANSELVAYLLSYILSCISKLDIQDTLPGLQHDFCALWNKIVLEVCQNKYSTYQTLNHTQHLYITLHQETNSAQTTFDASTDDNNSILDRPSLYPLCTIPGHESNINSTSENAHPPNIPSIVVLLPHTLLNTVTESSLHNVPHAT